MRFITPPNFDRSLTCWRWPERKVTADAVQITLPSHGKLNSKSSNRLHHSIRYFLDSLKLCFIDLNKQSYNGVQRVWLWSEDLSDLDMSLQC